MRFTSAKTANIFITALLILQILLGLAVLPFVLGVSNRCGGADAQAELVNLPIIVFGLPISIVYIILFILFIIKKKKGKIYLYDSFYIISLLIIFLPIILIIQFSTIIDDSRTQPFIDCEGFIDKNYNLNDQKKNYYDKIDAKTSKNNDAIFWHNNN